MATKVLDPTIYVPPIVVEIDKDAVAGIDENMKMMGQYVPLLKFGENNINWSKIKSFELEVSLYSFPRISITVIDDDYLIRSYLGNELDTGICRVGYNNFRMQFNVFYTDVYNIGDNTLQMEGMLWCEDMYDNNDQVAYKNSNIQEILKQICQDCELGLYVFENDELSQEHETIVQAAKSNWEFLNEILMEHTTNMWLFDPYHFLQVGTYDEMIKQDVAQYTLNVKDGTQFDEPKPMIFLYNFAVAKKKTPDDQTDEDPDKYKIPLKAYSPDKNIGIMALHTKRKYTKFTENNSEELIQREFGFSSEECNTFSGFTSHRIPFADEIRRKAISNQKTIIKTEFIVPEVVPFSVIELELYQNSGIYKNKISEGENGLDTEHSGKKLVIGYTIRYDQERPNTDTNQLFEQEIVCI